MLVSALSAAQIFRAEQETQGKSNVASTLKITNMSLATSKPDTSSLSTDANSIGPAGMMPISDDKSAGALSSQGALSTACMSCESSLDPMFDDANLSPFDVLLYPPHNPFSDPEDQLLQFASETHPGNVRFLVLLDLHRPFYSAAVRNNDQRDVDRICVEIVDHVVNGSVPSGAFKEWIVDEQDCDEGGDLDGCDLGDSTGVYGQDGGWDDLGCGQAARTLVLRGLRNAPVTSEFDIMPQGNVRREFVDLGGADGAGMMTVNQVQSATAAVAAGGDYPDTDEADNNAIRSAPIKKSKAKDHKKNKRSFVKKMLGKKSKNNKSASRPEPFASASAPARSIAAAASAAIATADISRQDKCFKRHLSDSDSITLYAKQSRRRRLSGLPTSLDEPIPKSDVTPSDCFLYSKSASIGAAPTIHEGHDGEGESGSNKENNSDVHNHALGLSKANKNRAGNRRMMALIDMYKASYDAVKSDPTKRAAIVAEIAATMYRGGAEPGRFLKEDPQTGKYREVSCERAMVTIEHLLCVASPKGG